MRKLSAESSLRPDARPLSRRSSATPHLVAFYSAVAVIAGVVFGSLPVHPF